MPVTVSIRRRRTTPEDIEATNNPEENSAPTYNAAQNSFEWRQIGGPGGIGDMLKSTYDPNENGIVDNAEKLEGLSLADIQLLPPAMHGNERHLDSFITTCDKHTKADHDALGIDAATLEGLSLVSVRDHEPRLHGNERHDEAFLTTCNKHTKPDHDALGIDAASVSGRFVGVAAGNLAFYNASGRVVDSERLGGYPLSSVQDHDPKMHTLAYHDVKKLDSLDELTPDHGVIIDGCLIKDGKAADSLLLDGKSKGLNDGNICELPTAVQGQVLKRGSTGWEAGSTAGNGDMLASVYDPNGDGVVDNASKLEGKAKGLDDGDICELPSASEGQILRRGSSNWGAHDNVSAIGVIIDGGGAEITPGIKADLEIPFACSISRVTLLADQSGNIVIDIWKDTYADFPPTATDSICASAKPTISAAQKSQDSTLSGWTTDIAAGDILRFYVESCSSIQRCTVSLRVVKK